MEKIDLFKHWHLLKYKIETTERLPIYFYQREIWWAYLGYNIGHEENGKNASFTRPVLIIKKFNRNLVLAIPLSSQIKKEMPYYHYFLFNQEEQGALINQMKALSPKRLIRKIGKVDKDIFFNLMEKIIVLIKRI